MATDIDDLLERALEVARDSAEGAQDPVICNMLETAVTKTWLAILAHPQSYVMTREEFAIFNYFQHRFIGIRIAVTARKRYWDQYDSLGPRPVTTYAREEKLPQGD